MYLDVDNSAAAANVSTGQKFAPSRSATIRRISAPSVHGLCSQPQAARIGRGERDVSAIVRDLSKLPETFWTVPGSNPLTDMR